MTNPARPLRYAPTLAHIVAALALASAGCSASAASPGDPSYLTGTLCVSDGLADAASRAAEDWHDSSPKVALSIVQGDGDDCDATMVFADLPAHTEGRTGAGHVQVASSARTDARFFEIVSHEIGHLLLGPAWARENPDDPGHSPAAGDLMSAHGGSPYPSADDVARLP